MVSLNIRFMMVQMLVWSGEDIQVHLPAVPQETRSNRLALRAGSQAEAQGPNLREREMHRLKSMGPHVKSVASESIGSVTALF